MYRLPSCLSYSFGRAVHLALLGSLDICSAMQSEIWVGNGSGGRLDWYGVGGGGLR